MWERAQPEICGHDWSPAFPWEKSDHCGYSSRSPRLAAMWFSHIDEILYIILALYSYVSAKTRGIYNRGATTKTENMKSGNRNN